MLKAALVLLGILLGGAQYWLGRRVFHGGKPHLAAVYILQRILLGFLFLAGIMVVYPVGLLYGAAGMVVTAIALPILGNRWK